MRNFVLVVVAALIAGGAGYFAYRHWAIGANGAMEGQPLPTTAGLMDLDGHPHTLSDWQGKLVLINFWATWCGPCLQEIPELAKAQDKYSARGLQLVGPAVDDPDAVRGMIASLKINYPVLVTPSSDQMIKTMESLSNTVGGLPFSVLVGADGKIIDVHLGAFTGPELTSLIEPHLPK